MLVFFDGWGQWQEDMDDGSVRQFSIDPHRYPGVYRLQPSQETILKYKEEVTTSVLLPAIGHSDAPDFLKECNSEVNLDKLLFYITRDEKCATSFVKFRKSDIVPEEPKVPGPTQIPAYLDKDHDMHSEELTIAISTWQAVLECNPPSPNRGSRKSLIEDHLRGNYKLTAQAIGRIATMLNPDKSGGAPSSGK